MGHCTSTSANSVVSLKGELSKPRLFPGELASTKPKSMWMMWPSESTKMLPLCLRTAECKQHAFINHGCECIKSPAPEGHRPKDEWATCDLYLKAQIACAYTCMYHTVRLSSIIAIHKDILVFTFSFNLNLSFKDIKDQGEEHVKK